MQKYIGSDVTSMVTLPVIIFEPMTMLQKMAEVCSIVLEGDIAKDKHFILFKYETSISISTSFAHILV